MIHMQKQKNPLERKLVQISRILLLVFVVLTVCYAGYYYYSEYYLSSPSYTQNPKHWIDNQGQGIQNINTLKVTSERAAYKNGIIDYNDGTVSAAFQSYGLYNGDFFSTYAVEGDKAVIEIGPNMDPNNGIMEIYILEKFENGVPYIYVFADSEWIQHMPTTNLIWGKSFENEERASFEKIKDGIYYAKVLDDKDRFIAPADDGNDWQQVGGILVGNLHKEDWQENKLSDKILIHFN
jgi:hypothetical protein